MSGKKPRALSPEDEFIEERPPVVQSVTYKLKSHFVNHSIYITIGYIELEDGRKRPLEIFINSRDLTKSAEFALLGRLLSAIFRRTANPVFILEELTSIYDPNGGYLSKGKFYASIYAEIAEVIEKFFKSIGLLSPERSESSTRSPAVPIRVDEDLYSSTESNDAEDQGSNHHQSLLFQICPACSSKTLKYENSCYICFTCGYSRCD